MHARTESPQYTYNDYVIRFEGKRAHNFRLGVTTAHTLKRNLNSRKGGKFKFKNSNNIEPLNRIKYTSPNFVIRQYKNL